MFAHRHSTDRWVTICREAGFEVDADPLHRITAEVGVGTHRS
jgi:hypothetical protein